MFRFFRNLKKLRKPRPIVGTRGNPLSFENLESRALLDSNGFLQGADAHLTLSFAPDGASIAGQANALAATFDTIAPTADWQATILGAFQTWAKETNADIGRVSDSGDSFGAPGRSQGDQRFGDIRIGAIEMSPEVGAVSVPVDGVVTGTWFADVVFNTAFTYNSLADIYAVALHEAGNVFGLEDSADPNSPLYSGGTPNSLIPTSTDISDLQELHGTRAPDFNESPEEGGGSTNNDSFATATRITVLKSGNENEGTAPSILYGDITTLSDLDFFRLKTPGDYSGAVTIQVRSTGISLLAPELKVYDAAKQLIGQVSSTSMIGEFFTYQIPSVTPDMTFYFEVSGAHPNLNGIGGYSLVVVFDDINQIDQATIDSLASGQYRFLEQEQFETFFEADADDLIAVDANSNDTLATATALNTVAGFVQGTRYEYVGSIHDSTDVDFYKVKAPDNGTPALDVMTVVLNSLDSAGLVPKATVYDDTGQQVAATILTNGGGEYIIQVEGITPDDDYKIKVEAADTSGPFNTGNYELSITFGSEPVQLATLSSGTVGNGTTKNIHTLYVGQPQLFHLAFEVDPAAVTAPTVLVVKIFDDMDQEVYRIASTPGETRSREAVLLQPGIYSVEVVPLTLDGSVPPAISYSLLGTSISDPFVGDPNDPTNNPFACTEPGMEGLFCYPGGFISPDPFLWDTFIDSLATPPETPDLATLISALLGDWWSWVWQSTGVNGPPLAQSDTTHVQDASALVAALSFVAPTGSVLDNDIEPEGDAVVAIKKSDPVHGALVLDPNGTFVYTPDMGFVGRDEFTYSAYDFMQESAVATVSIIVGISGDFNTDGNVTGIDFLTWQRNAGRTGGAVLTDGDSNFDGNVDSLDLGVWQGQYLQESTTVGSGGDANGDGLVGGLDFLAWQRGLGITSGALASDGDADADGDVDSQDLAIWESNYGDIAPTISSNSTEAAAFRSSQLMESPGTIAQPISIDLESSPLAANDLPAVAIATSTDARSYSNVFLELPSSVQLPLASHPRHLWRESLDRANFERKVWERHSWIRAPGEDKATIEFSHSHSDSDQPRHEGRVRDEYFADFETNRFSDNLDDLGEVVEDGQ